MEKNKKVARCFNEEASVPIIWFFVVWPEGGRPQVGRRRHDHDAVQNKDATDDGTPPRR